MFHGTPIIAYSIEAADKSGLFDEIWVSTEDREIADVAWQYGAKWYPRPMALTTDDFGTQEVTAECLRELGRRPAWRPEYACCIYATTPMLRADDLVNGYNLMRVIDDYAYVPGWFYFGRAEWFGVRSLTEPAPLVVGEERYIDINTEDDWKRAEEMYAALNFFTDATASP